VNQPDSGAIEDAPAGDAAPTAESAKGTTPGTKSGTSIPLPADTIGKAKTGAADGRAKAAADGKAAADTPAATAAAPETSAAKNGLKPSFTPSASTLAATPAPTAATPSARPAPAPSPAPAKPAAAPTAHPGAGTYSYAPPPSRPRSDEPAGTRSPAHAQHDGDSGDNGSSHSAASAASSAVAGAASAVAGAAAGATEAAAGLATSVASAWQRRGSNGKPAGKPTATRGPQVRKPARRQAMLTLARVEPWSVMKFSFVASVVAFIILFVAVAVLYMVLAALGVFDSLQHTVSSITGAQGTSGTDISHYYSASVVLGYTAMLGALNIVLITAMSTVGSVIYNLIAKTIGGIEVTLRETD
jgi:hypothetical protein